MPPHPPRGSRLRSSFHYVFLCVTEKPRYAPASIKTAAGISMKIFEEIINSFKVTIMLLVRGNMVHE